MLDNGCTELGSIGMVGLIPVELPKILGRKFFGPVHVQYSVDGRADCSCPDIYRRYFLDPMRRTYTSSHEQDSF